MAKVISVLNCSSESNVVRGEQGCDCEPQALGTARAKSCRKPSQKYRSIRVAHGTIRRAVFIFREQIHNGCRPGADRVKNASNAGH